MKEGAGDPAEGPQTPHSDSRDGGGGPPHVGSHSGEGGMVPPLHTNTCLLHQRGIQHEEDLHHHPCRRCAEFAVLIRDRLHLPSHILDLALILIVLNCNHCVVVVIAAVQLSSLGGVL